MKGWAQGVGPNTRRSQQEWVPGCGDVVLCLLVCVFVCMYVSVVDGGHMHGCVRIVAWAVKANMHACMYVCVCMYGSWGS